MKTIIANTWLVDRISSPISRVREVVEHHLITAVL